MFDVWHSFVSWGLASPPCQLPFNSWPKHDDGQCRVSVNVILSAATLRNQKNKWKNDNFENVGRTSRKHVFWTNLAHAYPSPNPWLYSVRFFHQVAWKHSQSLMIVTKQGFLMFTPNFDLKGVIHLKNLKSTLVAPNSAITFSIMRDGLCGVAQKSLNHVRTYLIFGSHCCKSVCRSFSRFCQTHKFSNGKCSCPMSGDNDYGVVNQRPNFVCLPEQLMKGADDVNKNAQRNKNFCKIMRNVECLNYRHRVSNLLVFAKIDLHARRWQGWTPNEGSKGNQEQSA